MRRVLGVLVGAGLLLPACNGSGGTAREVAEEAVASPSPTTASEGRLGRATTAVAGTPDPSASEEVGETTDATAPAPGGTWPPRPASCPPLTPADDAATGGPLGATPAELGEVSGMVASRANPGLLWLHNDSGDQAQLYLVGEDLRIRTVLTLPDVFALDWEALAAGPGPAGDPWLWVADTGDNLLVRPFVDIHGVAEPALGPAPPAVAASGPVITLRVRYASGPTDVEAFMVDPRSGDGVLLTKTLGPDGRSAVLTIPADALRRGGEVVAEEEAAVVVTDAEDGARAADVSADGTLVLAKDLQTTSIWLRGADEGIVELLAAEPVAPCTADLGQAEALAVSVDGRSVWTLDEGTGSSLRRFVVES